MLIYLAPFFKVPLKGNVESYWQRENVSIAFLTVKKIVSKQINALKILPSNIDIVEEVQKNIPQINELN